MNSRTKPPPTYTRQQFLEYQRIIVGEKSLPQRQRVDMDEEMTWAEWEEQK